MVVIRFDNRVAIVTGAGRGLGESYVRLLSTLGARVVMNDVSEPDLLKLSKDLKSKGASVHPHFGDIGRKDVARDLVRETVSDFGGVDVVIANAGILRDRSFHKMSVDEFEEVIRIHLMGTAYVAHAAWPFMRERNYGRLIFTTSVSGLWGNFGQCNYSAAKLGIVGLMNALKLEAGVRNICVNTVAPIAITPLVRQNLPNAFPDTFTSEHVARLVAYLASDKVDFSGQTFDVAGNRIARTGMSRTETIDIMSDIQDVQDYLSGCQRVINQSLRKPYGKSFSNSNDAMLDFVATESNTI